MAEIHHVRGEVKQSGAYVFMLEIPHIPEHSAGMDEGRKSLKQVSLAEGVRTLLDSKREYISTPMWLNSLPPSATPSDPADVDEVSESRDGAVVIFTTHYVELMMKRLKIYGVGENYGTMSIFPTSLQFRAEEHQSRPASPVEAGPNTKRGITDHTEHHNFLRDFMGSINSRVIVEEVLANVHSGATFSFDYMIFVIVASMIAGVGLATNNTVAIVASMLVSPIMGPILAITFGITTGKSELIKMGILNELISLFMCVLIGFITAICSYGFNAPVHYNWPTAEMAGRGEWAGIIGGVFIALPSGAGVALSVLSNNANSLVGVAISASLLPPAVNTGMCLAYWMMSGNDPSVDSSNLGEISYISLLLTLVNIGVIIVTALVFFKIKEVVSIPGESLFWKNDLQAYKNANQNIKKRGQGATEMANFAKKLATDPRFRQKVDADQFDTISGTGSSGKKYNSSSKAKLEDIFASPEFGFNNSPSHERHRSQMGILQQSLAIAQEKGLSSTEAAILAQNALTMTAVQNRSYNRDTFNSRTVKGSMFPGIAPKPKISLHPEISVEEIFGTPKHAGVSDIFK